MDTDQLGSPPRMRVKPMSKSALSNWLGITPAHAGKTIDELVSSAIFRDHPRACG